MLNPVQKEHELCCPGCGAVLQNINEPQYHEEKPTIPPSLNVFLLGSAVQTNIKFKFNRDSQQLQYERSLRRLLNITKDYGVNDRIAYETMNLVKKNKRGLYSYQKQIKQLLNILSKDENYKYFPIIKEIKERYENVTGI